MTRRLRSTRLVGGLAAAGLLMTSMAVAAEPESGSVSKTAPKTEWKGTLQNSGVFYNAWAEDPSMECSPPACDTYALKVVDGGHNLTLTKNNSAQNTAGGDPGCGINVTFPDGTYQYTQGSCGPKTTLTVKLKNVKPGDYVVRVAISHVCCSQSEYKASAFIPEFLAGPPAPAPAPAPAPSGPQSAPDAAPQLTIKASNASARKLTKRRRYAITATTSAPLNAVTAKLLKGKKAIGTAKLTRLEGTKKLTLKLAKRKVKKGKYTVTVSGTDDSGRVVTAAKKIRVKK